MASLKNFHYISMMFHTLSLCIFSPIFMLPYHCSMSSFLINRVKLYIQVFFISCLIYNLQVVVYGCFVFHVSSYLCPFQLMYYNILLIDNFNGEFLSRTN